MGLLEKLFGRNRPAAPVEEPVEPEEADQVGLEHESDKTSALAAPPTLEGQKFFEP